ncbi:hypothetical protein FRC10_012246 [Ceratobasidium sp. 414]|nr:hypothetical protein FRC10_012246 [Ceratobasidium sp. 414]
MSFIDSILSSAPAGSNPYAYAAGFVATIIPRKPDWYFSNIIAAGVVAAINLISTIACFLVMWRRSRAGTGVGLWFFRTRGVPYIMPNALTMFLFWNLIFMLLMQPYIWLNYFAYYSPSLQVTSRMYFWYGFVFIWDATGMWTSAFGTLYATLLPKLFTVTPSDRPALEAFFLHPITLNTLCFLPPIGLAITQVVTSTYSAIAWSDIVHTQFGLIDLLTILAGQWSASGGKQVQQNLLSQAGEMGSLFLKQKDRSQTAFQRNAWTCGSWYLLCMILFTPTAVWLLWVIRDTMAQRTRRPTPHLPPGTPGPTALVQQPHLTAFGDAQPRNSGFPFSHGHRVASSTGKTVQSQAANSKIGNTQQDDTVRQLKRALYTATLQFAATFFCLGFAAASWLWLAADAGRMIVSPTLHAIAILLTIWVYVVVGCFVNLFIMIRTRRVGDSPASGGNAVPLSMIKGSRISSHIPSEPDKRPVYIITHTTTHVQVDDPLRLSIGSEAGGEVGNGSAYSLNSAQLEGKGKELEGV